MTEVNGQCRRQCGNVNAFKTANMYVNGVQEVGTTHS